MNMEKEMMYEAPIVETVEVQVELGFDASLVPDDPKTPGEAFD